MRRITLIATGGTIEKTYDERTGRLDNKVSIVHEMLGLLRLEGTAVQAVPLLQKDSLDLTDEDRQRILEAVRSAADAGADGVIVLHGTDTLCVTGGLLERELGGTLGVPVILTGAMRPFEMKHSDALQNLTEAVFATGALPAGVYVVAHGRALRFPGPIKDHDAGTFVLAGAGGA
ncbi:MAG: asparaginase domain-containing protein [Phycisphaerales bacterium]